MGGKKSFVNKVMDWLGREDSNLRMAESKSAALPLGDAPIAARERGSRLYLIMAKFSRRDMGHNRIS